MADGERQTYTFPLGAGADEVTIESKNGPVTPDMIRMLTKYLTLRGDWIWLGVGIVGFAGCVGVLLNGILDRYAGDD